MTEPTDAELGKLAEECGIGWAAGLGGMSDFLRAFARAHGVHLWIVAHPTKLQKEPDGSYPVPTPYDVAGSAHWRNKADNCIAVWRNTAANTSAVEVHVQKVRKKSVGQVGMATLRYDRITGQYHDQPMNRLPDEGREW